MIFYENCLLADNSHEIPYLIFFRKLGNLSSAAVVIGALRVNVNKHSPLNSLVKSEALSGANYEWYLLSKYQCFL